MPPKLMKDELLAARDLLRRGAWGQASRLEAAAGDRGPRKRHVLLPADLVDLAGSSVGRAKMWPPEPNVPSGPGAKGQTSSSPSGAQATAARILPGGTIPGASSIRPKTRKRRSR